jgi:uncharacterized protein YqgV (UPF0045/DUF77 family)
MKQKPIPTIEEILAKNGFHTLEILKNVQTLDGVEGNQYDRLMKSIKEIAEMHCTKQQQAINRNARIDINGEKSISAGFKNFSGESVTITIDKHSITNAYPLSNIK